MSAQTRLRIASNSKLFAAIAIMQLREAGKVRLDDPVEKHLPWFKFKPTGLDDGPIAIEQLLSHSSGLQCEVSFVPASLLAGSAPPDGRDHAAKATLMRLNDRFVVVSGQAAVRRRMAKAGI